MQVELFNATFTELVNVKCDEFNNKTDQEDESGFDVP